jgi:hypothetical protein
MNEWMNEWMNVAIEWVLFLGSIAFLWRNNSSSLFWSLIDLWGILFWSLIDLWGILFWSLIDLWGILFYSLIDLWGIWGNEWARTFVLQSPSHMRLFYYLLSLVDFDPLGVSWTLFSSSFTFVGIIFQVLWTESSTDELNIVL